MKISKLKAITIASTVVGSASLASVAGVTAGVVLNNQSSSNQDYSQTGNGNNGGGGDNSPSTNPNPDNPSNIDAATEANVIKSFTTKKTNNPNEKVFDALNQIKKIDDVWNFYPKPDNIPSNFTITLNNVSTTSQTPDSTLGIQVNVTLNNRTPVSFVVYGFSPYTDQDYKQIFEAANPSGKFTKDGKYFPYLDWKDLSKDPNSPDFFAKWFKPVIPVELSANNIIVTPNNFNLLPGNVVNFYYVLHSQDNKISVNASVPVSAYYEYQYPIYTDAYKPVTKSWKPGNFDFIKANLPENYTRSDFDTFMWKHWNGSTLVDAMNAYRYWYLFDQSNLTSKLESYALGSSKYDSIPDKYPIGLIIRGGNDQKSVSISPTYDASTNLNADKSYLKFNWHLINWKGNSLLDLMTSTYGWKGPFNIDASLNIGFNSAKPTSLNKDGLVSIPVTVTTDVLLDKYQSTKTYKHSQVVKKWDWTVLDALYYYFKDSSTMDKSYFTPFFYQFSETLKKQV